MAPPSSRLSQRQSQILHPGRRWRAAPAYQLTKFSTCTFSTNLYLHTYILLKNGLNLVLVNLVLTYTYIYIYIYIYKVHFFIQIVGGGPPLLRDDGFRYIYKC
jgi:hypothetical protein